jgi:hypothetical protein
MPAPYTPSSLTRGEQRIMDLWDQDMSAAEIAAELGIPEKRAMNIIIMYHDGDGHFDRNVIAGSRALLNAMQAARA